MPIRIDDDKRYTYLLPWQEYKNRAGSNRAGSMVRCYLLEPKDYVARVATEWDWYVYDDGISQRVNDNKHLKSKEDMMAFIDEQLVEFGYILLTAKQAKMMELLV